AIVIAFIGCYRANTPTSAVNPTAVRLREIEISAKGALTPLVRHAIWTGHRLRVTGGQNGLPVSERIGPWRIELHPDPKQNAVEIKGLIFAKNAIVRLDLDRDTLVIDGEEFQGRRGTGKSPLFGEIQFNGVAFEREEGKVTGKAAILIL